MPRAIGKFTKFGGQEGEGQRAGSRHFMIIVSQSEFVSGFGAVLDELN